MYYLVINNSPISRQEVRNVRRILDDGLWETSGEDNPEYVAWLAEGNEPEEWNNGN
jgi:hypothetical protein